MGRIVGTLFRTKATIDKITKVRAFSKTSQEPMKAQEAFLKELLLRHRDTDFGKKYHFNEIHSTQEFRKRVPIHQWKDISPYIEEVKKGNKTSLFPSNEKLLMFAATSGTTGQPKLVPVTETSYRHYGKYWDLHWSNIINEAPWAANGKALYFPGDPEEGYIGEIPFGAITAKAYEQQNAVTRALYPYPHQIAKVKNYDVRYYTIMRIGVEQNVTIIPIANPSTIITLVKLARERAKDIIDDIRTGRLRYQNQMPEELRKALLKQISPNPRRAAQLENILKETGDFLPRDYWNSRNFAINCFASGPLNLYLKQLPCYFDNPKIADFGLLASEGRLSFPIASTNIQKGCCLTLETNFFEFIPEDQIESPHPDILTLDQVELGKRYFILFSNFAGLYRYNISDVVEVTGFYGKVPLIYFCNKGKHYSNITGEKLSEIQVTESVRKAGERAGYHLEDFVVCLHWDEEKPGYTLLKSSNKQEDYGLLRELVNLVEEELMGMNIEYKSKRESLRLAPLTLKVVNGSGYEDYESKKQLSAHNLSQYKHVFLVGDPDFEKQFDCREAIVSTVNPRSSH
jgi:GH3 auxin-responsive promoter